MHWNIDALTLEADEPFVQARSEEAGGMTVENLWFSAGFDNAPMLVGLPGDRCSCPHWGYVLEGAMVVTHADASEETIMAGDVYHIPAGHTIRYELATRYLDFSPTEQLAPVSEHLQRKVAEMNAPS